jgi:tyrosine-specific transport protein
MDFKIVGSILLIVGTSIGAGMLALPIATAQLGFIGSILLLLGCWFVMTAGAFLLLEVNLWLPQNSNIISMAKVTLGPIGQVIAWVTYLLLLYSLLCAYIAGGSDLFHHLLAANGMHQSRGISAIIFTFLFGSIVYLGIRSVDYANRFLMFMKLATFVMLALLLAPLMSSANLLTGEIKNIASATAITITITSFGYATIVPSLRIYLASDIKKIKLAILIGSLIPLFCYAIWDAVIMGVIPLQGEHGLYAILSSKASTSSLVYTLSTLAAKRSISFFVNVFTSICVLTSFLGVSLCLVDFLADGLKQEKDGVANIFMHLLAFTPPLFIVLFYPYAFIQALEYAGIDSVILLILLPAWMALRGRYKHALAKGFSVWGGPLFLFFLIAFSLLMIVWSLIK